MPWSHFLIKLQENTCAGVFFNKVAGLQTCNIIKKILQHRCFLVNIAKFFRTILKNTSLSVLHSCCFCSILTNMTITYRKDELQVYCFNANEIFQFSEDTPWTQDVNWTYIRLLEYVQDVFLTSPVRSIYVQCLEAFAHFEPECDILNKC